MRVRPVAGTDVAQLARYVVVLLAFNGLLGSSSISCPGC